MLILKVENLNVKFVRGKEILHAIRNISFELSQGEVLAFAGESGSGKSVLSKTLGNLNDENAIISSGKITFYENGKELDLTSLYVKRTDKHYAKKYLKLLKAKIDYMSKGNQEPRSTSAKYAFKDEYEKTKAEYNWFKNNFYSKLDPSVADLITKKSNKLNGSYISYIFQDPSQALNPLLTVGSQIVESIMIHTKMSHEEAKKAAISLLQKVGINNPQKAYKALPSQFSGGMRQRIVIAIAVASRPKILIADEPTTALDVTVQKQILELLQNIQKEYNLSIIFITHDLGVIAKIADHINIMYAGSFIEIGTKKDIFFDPQHPYTWALLCSLPQFASKDQELFALSGTPPTLQHQMVGDHFAPRNSYALNIDFIYPAPMFKLSKTHYAKTWLLDPRAPKIEKPAVLEVIKNFLKDKI